MSASETRITLIGLGLACWPGWQLAGSRAPAFWGMLLYNAAIALYLALLGTVAPRERTYVLDSVR